MSHVLALTRVVSFSSGHRYWREDLPELENRRIFGKWASKFNHGHNYVLEVTVEGEMDPRHGMVVNIKDIDSVLQDKVVRQFDQRSINDEVSEMSGRVPTLENLLLHFAETLSRPPGGTRLARLRLEESPRLWGHWTPNMTTLTRSYEFAASHRLNVSSLSADENVRLFGVCNRPNGHGHNYVLEVSITGPIVTESGMMVRLDELDTVVTTEVVDRYDHRNLDMDVPELLGQNTTSEVVAQAIFERLDGQVPGKLVSVKLWETARNAFEVSR